MANKKSELLKMLKKLTAEEENLKRQMLKMRADPAYSKTVTRPKVEVLNKQCFEIQQKERAIRAELEKLS